MAGRVATARASLDHHPSTDDDQAGCEPVLPQDVFFQPTILKQRWGDNPVADIGFTQLLLAHCRSRKGFSDSGTISSVLYWRAQLPKGAKELSQLIVNDHLTGANLCTDCMGSLFCVAGELQQPPRRPEWDRR